MECPIEIREQIYKQTFELGVVFQLRYDESAVDVDDRGFPEDAGVQRLPPDRQDHRALIEDGIDDIGLPYLDHVLDCLEYYPNETAIPYLGYKLPRTPCTPLWCVNKTISNELKAIYSLPKVEALVQSAVRSLWYGDKMSPAVITLCELSRFDLCGDLGLALAWILNLPKRQRMCIRSLVINNEMLECGLGDVDRAWSKEREDVKYKYTPFTTMMRKELPYLQEVAFAMPWTKKQFYCMEAPSEILDMLHEGRLDTVRVLIDRHSPKPEDHWHLSSLLDYRPLLKPIYKKYGRQWSEAGRIAYQRELDRIEALGPRFEMKVEYLQALDDEKAKTTKSNESGASSRVPEISTGPQPFCRWLDAVTVVRFRRVSSADGWEDFGDVELIDE